MDVGATLGTLGEGPGGVRLPCKFRVRAVVCCSCCCIVCVASVIARRVRDVVARLAVDSLAVVFPYGGRLQASPGAVLLVVFGAFKCACAAVAERACMWRGLHRCRVVVCGTSGRCSVCRVAPLVERCDTCLWLLSAWCWLVVSSGEVLLELRTVSRLFLLLPCYLRVLGVLLVWLVRSDEFSQSSVLVVLWRFSQDWLAVPFGWAAFWRGSPRTTLGAFGGVYLGVVGQGVVRLVVRLAAALASLSR
ncbi:hypothetical protein Taro_013803 [Colocasia esculenta]|uniref:Uncharacterized protein n=1 Tax=Colocasia esculenta TaxID=4460 RepID=A0A843UD58_COLES|nr:hypothetical protein [Colocasia esculenta]